MLLVTARSEPLPTQCGRGLGPIPDERASSASTALGFLLADAARNALSRSSLERLALDKPLVDLALRRRAAAGFARHCDERELSALGPRLLRQPDALLVEGVLAAVADREPSAARTRLLLAHGRAEDSAATAVPLAE